MSQLDTIPITDIDPNPHRQLGHYPINEDKISVLMRSIEDVGLWEGVIGRRNGNRIELAFGHHRLEAARRCGLKDVLMIVRDDLDDEKMLKFMGRENGEEYRSDFLTLLETWEAAVAWLLPRADGSRYQPIEIAKVLGWTQRRASTEGYPDSVQMNRTAEACNAAHSLTSEGHLTIEDLRDLTANQAREILTRTNANIKRLAEMGKQKKLPANEVEKAQKRMAKAAKHTVEDVREGKVAEKDLRTQVDVNAYRFAKEAKRRDPLFYQYATQLADRLANFLTDDASTSRLEQIETVIEGLIEEEDKRVVMRVFHELDGVGKRANEWKKRLGNIRNVKVVTQNQIEDGRTDHEISA